MPKIKRVAAYARVSSGKEAMLHSLSAQVSYYCELIQNTPNGNTLESMRTKLYQAQKIQEKNSEE